VHVYVVVRAVVSYSCVTSSSCVACYVIGSVLLVATSAIWAPSDQCNITVHEVLLCLHRAFALNTCSSVVSTDTVSVVVGSASSDTAMVR